jgi:signal transduction histidine kinase
MISELLEFTRGARGPVALAPANYGEYVRKLVEEMSADLHDKNVTLTLRDEPPDAMIPFDQKRMNHVFANLIHNAVDATGPNGQIFLSFEEKPHEIITHVEDSGPGIAPEILPTLFEAFATYGKAKGSGLGLSICKRVIEDHRGWITARNEPGHGAIFSFGLPRE